MENCFDNYPKVLREKLKLLTERKIQNFVVTALNRADPKFWVSCCGKHHPPENNVEGGLVIHSCIAADTAIRLFKFFDITDDIIKQKIIAACILHDLCKGGDPWGEKFDSQHGKIAELRLKSQITDNDKDLTDIADLVGAHMGIWNHPVPTPAVFLGQFFYEKDLWRLIVQLADYFASGKVFP